MPDNVDINFKVSIRSVAQFNWALIVVKEYFYIFISLRFEN